MTWADLSVARYRRYAAPAGILLLLTAWAMWRVEADARALGEGIGKGLSMLVLFFPPAWHAFQDMVEPAVVTVLVAAAATPIGTVCAVIFGLAAARNVAPPWLRTSARSVIALGRGLPEIVVLLILVAAFGMGPFPAVVALVVGSIGMLGKLVADAIEEIDARTVESVECVGATQAQVIRYAVLPQVFPSLLANSMFRFEVNIRASVLLGAVGAGGIGYELVTAMTQLEYSKVTVAAFVSFMLVFASERGSDLLRSKVLAQGRLS